MSLGKQPDTISKELQYIPNESQNDKLVSEVISQSGESFNQTAPD